MPTVALDPPRRDGFCRHMRRITMMTLVAAAASALASPVVGPEVPVETPTAILSLTNGNPMKGASNGTVSLLAWFDSRDRALFRVHAARLDAQGQVLDKPFVDLGDTSSSASQLDVGFDGTNFLVTWVNAARRTLVFRRVSPQGVVVDATEQVVRTVTASFLDGPVISTDGAGHSLLVWMNRASLSAAPLVEAARLDASGAVLDPTPLVLGTAAATNTFPAATFDGAQHLVVFHTGAGTSYFLSQRRVSVAGAVQGTTPTVVATLGNWVPEQSVACDGTNCLVAFADPVQLVGTRVANNGTVVDATPLVLSSAPSSFDKWPSVSFDGTQYWVVATQTPNTLVGARGLAVRVSTAGAALGTTLFGVVGHSRESGFVGPGNVLYGLDWGAEQVTRIGASGALLDPAPIGFAWAGNNQRTGHLAFGGGQLLVAWVDDAEARDVVLARRFSPGLAPLDATPIRLAEAPMGASLTVSDVAFDGHSFVIGWSGLGGGWVVRVSTSGARLDPLGGLAVSMQPRAAPRLAVDGTQTWMEWEQQSGSGGSEVMVARLSRAGIVLDVPSVTVTSTTTALPLGVPGPCFDGTQVWASWLSSNRINVTRLSPAAVVLDPAGIPLNGSMTFQPSVSSGSPCAATWLDSAGDTYLSRVSLDGGLDGDGALLTNSSLTRVGPTTVWNGGSWVVARVREMPTELHVARWSQGASLDPVPTAAALPVLPQAVQSTSDRAGTSWVLTERFDTSPGAQSVRLFLRTVLDFRNGGACATGAECGTGNCIDGVCCDTPCAGGPVDCQACSVAAGAAVDGICGPSTGNACAAGQCSAGTCTAIPDAGGQGGGGGAAGDGGAAGGAGGGGSARSSGCGCQASAGASWLAALLCLLATRRVRANRR